ncbi:serine hydrolase domain-containing protein [Sphingosinicella rhizophila]|uniref:Serine hydrolase domain-containing protein n=1 Tax=Sphingosinicella rhizophila TaxID=3050082 RepID=A0ABU3QBJ0_9SPHN|nr:serine hydrolase domain-containing protein [Sphingosinicella sp. GR2756]MDT9600514.1 serine hydrolase domain-containing protein [Sphingosinicella sp. GR2756]
MRQDGLASLFVGAFSALLILSSNVHAEAGIANATVEATSAAQPATPRLKAYRPATTTAGNNFIVPAGWSLTTNGDLSVLEAPEGNSWVALVDVKAKRHDAAITEAWAAYRPSAKRPLQDIISGPDKDGWTDQRIYSYQTSPGEHRTVTAGAMRHGDRWMAWIQDVDNGVREKRSAALTLIMEGLLPKGYSRESFAGRTANILDRKHIAELTAFIRRAQQEFGIPGVSVGLVQGGRTVFAGGFGVRELGRPEAPDAETLYLIASVTKPLTTLMLGKLVDEQRLRWDMPVTSVFPSFRLGNADTTRSVQIRHLLCACTGLPRQDLDWLLEFERATPATTLAALGAVQPTSRFGEMFQYSNPLAAAAGFVGGHALFPDKELGRAYDEAMQSRVFDPLGMKSTTFDFRRALSLNHGTGHALDMDGNPAFAVFDINYAIVPLRPAGGAWSNVDDMLKYVSMELAGGKLPNGSRYISSAILADRQAPNALIGDQFTYGMGLMVSSKYGVRVVSHPGSMFGYRSIMLWLPDHDVGAVILTNADQGDIFWTAFPRKFLELLFDGKAEADNEVEVAAKTMRERMAAERKSLNIAPEAAAVARLGRQYANPALGDLDVRKQGTGLIFDFGEWESPVASRANPDGTTSFVTIAPSFIGKEFVMGQLDGKSILSLRDAQHEYVFREK